ncbi:hypothetical protein JCM17960_30600 [Magnetospira thiophila]
MTLSLFLDVLVAVLLALTIGYAVVLNRRLAVLRQDRDELERLATEFASATVRADEGVRRLKATADELGAMMDSRIVKAEGLKEDLMFLIDRGDTVADKLESTVRSTRKEMPMETPSEAEGDEDEDVEPPAAKRAGRVKGKAARGKPNKGGRLEESLLAEGLMEEEPSEDESPARSDAELELLKALQSVK